MAGLIEFEFLHSVEEVQFHIHFRNISFIELTPVRLVQPGNFLCLETEASQIIKPLYLKRIN
jgi:hypothetical protein